MFRLPCKGALCGLSVLFAAACGSVKADPDAGADSDGGGQDGAADAGEPDAVDNAPAEATFLFPPGDGSTDADTITVRGTATDPDGIAAVRVNGVAALSSDGFAHWQAQLSLDVGPNSIEVDVEDDTGDIITAAAVEITVSPHLLSRPQSVAVLGSSNIYVTDTGLDAIYEVDPATGLRSLVSGQGRGTGTAFNSINGIAVDAANDRLIVADGAIVAVELATGDRSTINDDIFFSPVDPVVRGSSAIVVSNDLLGGADLVESVDLRDGTRTTISGGGTGSGDPFDNLVHLTVDGPRNRALVTDAGLDTLFAVNLGNGARTVLSSASVGGGPPFEGPSEVAVTSDGTTAFVSDTVLDAVVAVDLATGNRTIVADADTGSGPEIVRPRGIAVFGSDLLVVDSNAPALLQIDQASLDRTLLSSSRAGSGPPILSPGMIGRHPDGVRVLSGSTTELQFVELASGARAPLVTSETLSVPGSVVFESATSALVGTVTGVMRVDLQTGDVTDAAAGTGPTLGFSPNLALDAANGRVFAGSGTAILAVDLDTGNRTTISDAGTGTGPELAGVSGIVFDADNSRLLVADTSLDALLTVDVASGNRLIISNTDTGSGPVPTRPTAIRTDLAAGTALVVDGDLDALLSVNLANGNRTPVSDATTLGPSLQGPSDLDVDFAAGVAFVSDAARGLCAIDLETGDRIVFSH